MSEWMADDGTFGDMAKAPEATRELVEAKGYTSITDLVDSYKGAETKIGVSPDNLVVWDDKDLSNIHERLGRPKTPAEYNFDVPSDVLGEKRMERLRQYGHELGLSQNQLAAIAKDEHDVLTSLLAENQKTEDDAESDRVTKQTERVEALKSKWGTKDDESFNAVVAGAQKTAQDIGIFEAAEELGLSDNIVFVDAMKTLSERVAAPLLQKGSPNNVPGKDEELNTLINNPAYLDRMHADHEKVVKRVNQLHGIGA